MGVNLDKPGRWKADVAKSVDMYNEWFIDFAPKTFREARVRATEDVEATLKSTNNLKDVSPELLRKKPGVISTLRMSTCPPIAVDRLIGLSGSSQNLVKKMEEGVIPTRIKTSTLTSDLIAIAALIEKLADPDIFVWLGRKEEPSDVEVHRAATIVADRLCGSRANPIIRNAQEQRQLECIASWLLERGYTKLSEKHDFTHTTMPPGTFSFRMNVPVSKVDNPNDTVNIPVDAVIKRKTAKVGELALLVEAKSAGDFTNTNKRRKEEAQKVNQLRATYGDQVEFILFLCGYFDSGYLGYEAAEGIDWVWEHRTKDLEEFGL